MKKLFKGIACGLCAVTAFAFSGCDLSALVSQKALTGEFLNRGGEIEDALKLEKVEDIFLGDYKEITADEAKEYAKTVKSTTLKDFVNQTPCVHVQFEMMTQYNSQQKSLADTTIKIWRESVEEDSPYKVEWIRKLDYGKKIAVYDDGEYVYTKTESGSTVEKIKEESKGFAVIYKKIYSDSDSTTLDWTGFWNEEINLSDIIQSEEEGRAVVDEGGSFILGLDQKDKKYNKFAFIFKYSVTDGLEIYTNEGIEALVYNKNGSLVGASVTAMQTIKAGADQGNAKRKYSFAPYTGTITLPSDLDTYSLREGK